MLFYDASHCLQDDHFAKSYHVIISDNAIIYQNKRDSADNIQPSLEIRSSVVQNQNNNILSPDSKTAEHIDLDYMEKIITDMCCDKKLISELENKYPMTDINHALLIGFATKVKNFELALEIFNLACKTTSAGCYTCNSIIDSWIQYGNKERIHMTFFFEWAVSKLQNTDDHGLFYEYMLSALINADSAKKITQLALLCPDEHVLSNDFLQKLALAVKNDEILFDQAAGFLEKSIKNNAENKELKIQQYLERFEQQLHEALGIPDIMQ